MVVMLKRAGLPGAVLLLASGMVLAQEPGIGSGQSIFELRPSQRPLTVPPFESGADQPSLDLPAVEEPPSTAGLPYAIKVYVDAFRITGNTVFTDAELQAIVAPYTGREITNNELEEVRRRLTIQYINNGYINSGALIPDQKVADGTVDIEIVEGTLNRIEIEGTDRFKPEYFTSRLELSAGPPLNAKDIEERLQILIQNSLVEGIQAELQPGDRPGEAVLKAKVVESRPYDFAFVFDNKIPPSLGEVRGLAQGEVRNLAGRGDVLTGELELAQGIPYNVKARYLLPITPQDTTFGLYYEKGKAEVVERPFDELDIKTKLETVGLSLTHPFYRTPNEGLDLGLVLERRKTNTELLGEDFSFSPGVDDGRAVVSVLRFFQEWVQRSRNQVISARSTFSFGLDAFGSTINNNGLPDSDFVTWIPQFQWVRRFGERGHQLFFRFDGQVSSNSLLPIEKFSVGGLDSVRGYRSNQLVRDRGYAASLQYQVPVFKNATGMRNLQFAAFVDTGYAKNKSGPEINPNSITGVGVGLIWDPDRRVHLELYYANGLKDVPEGGEYSIQDESLYFRLVATPW